MKKSGKSINWDDISFIHRGKHRKEVLEHLDRPKTPTQLKEELKIHFNIISKTLIELESNNFVKCLNPDQKMARFYEITQKGRDVLEEV